MLTTRGWWFFMSVLAVLGLAVGTGARHLTVTALTLLIWFLGSWLSFLIRWRLSQGKLKVTRLLSNETGALKSLWARRSALVEVHLSSDSPWSLPYVLVSDRVPPLAHVQEGRLETAGSLGRGQTLTFHYRINCPAPGQLLFWGVKVQAADWQGFFSAVCFVRTLQSFRVLPPLADARGHVPAPKRRNLLPILGRHPHRRPGSGGDLLDLRDYLPGDPPKMIAWKISARRGRLMTKELESEVPIRSTLFLDVAAGTRLGRTGHSSLARLVEIAAAVAQANAAARDLTGLCLFDEEQVHAWIRPERGPRHLVRLMDILADVAALPPMAAFAPLPRLLPLAYGLAQDLYPELLDDDLNVFPWWLPLWSPQPAYALVRPLTRPRSLLGRAAAWATRLLLDSPLPLTGGGRRFSPHAHRTYRWRKKLAAILSVRYRLGPAGLARLLEDDLDCSRYLQQFLADHQVPCPLPLYDAQGRYLFASEKKNERLARALLRAVARGRDNELFVILADMLETTSSLDKVRRAAQIARARHHQVMVVCPWPPGVALPKTTITSPDPAQAGADRDGPRGLQDWLWQASTARLHQAYAEVRQAFASIGVPVYCARQEDAPALILERMQLLRRLERGVP